MRHDLRWPFWRLEWHLGPMLILHKFGYCPDFGSAMAVEVSTHDAVTADLCGVSLRTVQRWKAAGLTDRQADHVAIRLGVHPAAIFGRAWFDAVELEEVA